MIKDNTFRTLKIESGKRVFQGFDWRLGSVLTLAFLDFEYAPDKILMVVGPLSLLLSLRKLGEVVKGKGGQKYGSKGRKWPMFSVWFKRMATTEVIHVLHRANRSHDRLMRYLNQLEGQLEGSGLPRSVGEGDPTMHRIRKKAIDNSWSSGEWRNSPRHMA
jgi:hypothetical protein